jgi:hypothetical protein
MDHHCRRHHHHPSPAHHSDVEAAVDPHPKEAIHRRIYRDPHFDGFCLLANDES